MTVLQLRRPGADVQAIQLTARALPAIRSELAARDIHHEVHEHGLLITGTRGQPIPCDWRDWLVFDMEGYWDVYSDVVVRGWTERAA